MIRKIAKKEFLLNLMTFKFAVGLTTLLVLLTIAFSAMLRNLSGMWEIEFDTWLLFLEC